jgi:tRNA threonylcarbamoyladenosine biosynthesis protein TsaB
MLLALDSATRILSLALHDGQQVCAETTWSTPNQHSVELMPAIQRLLAQSHTALSALELLAVSQGPGSFNGLRIGLSSAKGLALALHIPLIPIPTLDIIAAAQPPFDGRLLTVVQAGRGRVCAGTYRWHKRWVAQPDVRIVAWDALLKGIEKRTLISGEVDEECRALLDKSEYSGKPIQLASPSFALRRAGFLADLAWERWRGGEVGDPALAVPFYLHQPGVPHP